MGAIANFSIRSKLVGIILLTTLASSLVGFAFVLREGRRSFEQDLVRSLRLIADIQSRYSAVGLAFDQRELTGLDKLADPDPEDYQFAPVPLITDAYIFDKDGRLYDSWSRYAQVSLPASIPPVQSFEIGEGHADYFQPILHERKRIGTLYLRASTEVLERRRAEHARTLGWLMAGVLAISAAIAWMLQGLISKPIMALASVARSITRDGDYSVRVDKPGEDEIGQLYDGFNAMLAQIQQRQGELERSNRDLDQFAYVASHDLKAPLRAIANLSTWLAEDHASALPPEASEQLDLLRARVRRMDGLIDGILQYSRLGRGDSSVQGVDVKALLNEVIEMIEPPSGMTVEVGPMPVVVTHRLRLSQVFANLIANAIRHHHRPDRGRIEISSEPTEHGFRFHVKDDGPGIAPEDQARIFRMFQTLGPDGSGGETASTGLGLALVQKLVEDEGGAIHVDSEPGEGATFHIDWPILDRHVEGRDPAAKNLAV